MWTYPWAGQGLILRSVLGACRVLTGEVSAAEEGHCLPDEKDISCITTGLRLVSNLLWMDFMPPLFVVVFGNYKNWLVKLLHRAAADRLSTERPFAEAVLKSRQHLMVGTQMCGTWVGRFVGALMVCRVSQPRHPPPTSTLSLWKAEKKIK